jgi:hypothetical protein
LGRAKPGGQALIAEFGALYADFYERSGNKLLFFAKSFRAGRIHTLFWTFVHPPFLDVCGLLQHVPFATIHAQINLYEENITHPIPAVHPGKKRLFPPIARHQEQARLAS